jgi:dipeptidyl-peptidase-3
MKRLLLIPFFSLLAACGSDVGSGHKSASAPQPAKDTPASYTGELERLGKDGQDILVLGVEATGFEKLSLNQKKLAYYLYRAAIAGNEIFTDQAHRYAVEIQRLLEQIFLHSDGLSRDEIHAVQDYLKYIWINHGQYGSESHVKYVPNYLTFEILTKTARQAASKGAQFELQAGEDLDKKLARLRPYIFDASFEPLQTNQKKGEDIIATSFVNLYDPDITQAMFDSVPEQWKKRINVRFALQNGKVAPQLYKIGGVYGKYLETISYWLKPAVPLAESDQQRRGLEALLSYYQTGDENKFREYSVDWLKSNTTIDYLNGFIESYYDPRGVISQFEGNVNYVSDSTLITRLAANADYFEKRMPWPDAYKRSHVTPPVANVVQVIVETGDSGPTSPVAYNLPNYEDIRRDVGSKNIILLNIEEAQSEKILEQTIQEFFLPRHQDLFRKYGKLGRQWEVYMHEVIGHGAGKPDDKLKGEPRIIIGRAYSALEECRADLVALYHIFDPKLVEIGAFTAAEQKQVAEAQYIGYLQNQMTRYRSLEDDIVREAHRKGRELVLEYLVSGGENGNKDFGVKVIQVNGNYFVEINDMAKAHQGVAEILDRLQVIKSTGDAEGATHIFDRFGTRVNPAWRNNIRQRAARLKIPQETAFVFPQLVPVVQNSDITDVRLETREDLTAQQLRFSRWRFNTDLAAK